MVSHKRTIDDAPGACSLDVESLNVDIKTLNRRKTSGASISVHATIRTRAVSLSVWQFHTFIMVSVQLPPLLSSFHSELLLIMRQRAPLNPVKSPCKWNRSISIGCGEKYTWFTESKNVLAMVYRNAPLITVRREEAESRQTRDTIR